MKPDIANAKHINEKAITIFQNISSMLKFYHIKANISTK
jgi:hypothetical protein